MKLKLWKKSWMTLKSGAGKIAKYVNGHPHVTLDLGQVIFTDTTTMTGDGPWQFRLWGLTGNKWVNSDVEMEGGAGVVPYTFKKNNPANSIQWGIGLELALLVKDPWRVYMTTDHPNGARVESESHDGRRLETVAEAGGGGVIRFVRVAGWPVELDGKSHEVLVEARATAASGVAAVLEQRADLQAPLQRQEADGSGLFRAQRARPLGASGGPRSRTQAASEGRSAVALPCGCRRGQARRDRVWRAERRVEPEGGGGEPRHGAARWDAAQAGENPGRRIGRHDLLAAGARLGR